MSSSTSTALVPAYDFERAVQALKTGIDTELSTVLAGVATAPHPQISPSDAVATVARVGTELLHAIAELPSVFNKFTPKSRRSLNQTELARLAEEKEVIDRVEKALKLRKQQIHEIVSTHFDCEAEREGRAAEDTPRDDKGHYLIASPANREEQPVKGGGKLFARERAADTTKFSYAKLKALYEAGKISRTDYLACTRRVVDREIDEGKLRQMLVSPKRRKRAQNLIAQISDVTRPSPRITLRNSK